MKLTCSRMWEAEALEDGRLEGSDRRAFERHASTCDACRAELATLADLRRQMGAIGARLPNELERQRARGRLLREANRRAVAPRETRTWIPVALPLAAVVIVFAIYKLKTRAPSFEAIHVTVDSSGDVPRPAFSDSLASAAESVAEASASAPFVAPVPHRPLPPSADERFDHAMQAFVAGRYADADAELATFARSFPGDRRCEDAAFLRAVSRSRLGDREGGAALARSYLRDYPAGLRRSEAERLADLRAP